MHQAKHLSRWAVERAAATKSGVVARGGVAMWVMVSGPYTAGGAGEAERRENLAALNRVALQVLQKGHIPVVGVNMGLPLIEVAGPAEFDRIMMPVSLALAERCDACLRIGGPSKGADAEADVIRASGKPVYGSIDDLPSHGQ